ncbi:hypothetical protein Halha_0384 [Halobacteroides halobius DSM 5150]|uniref:Sporulation protein YtrH n=1 Tax=Halobacteroides halobius (strain ATCC 35273 / DSM 5150 / MD-1) TaxID=748449 RepID=L0K7Q2_HALHC|nr:YtrH family sporulation protein [Halobacteroides halobius]AGB40379.1 hypothetical protein Halha_0384 [Halobacteroides halobius DSM 5150]
MQRLLIVFFISLGIILGGSLIGSIGATLAKESPLKSMRELSKELKLWAVVISIGGTFSNLKLFEGGLLEGEILLVVKQFILLITGFLGAQLGIWIITILTGGN